MPCPLSSVEHQRFSLRETRKYASRILTVFRSCGTSSGKLRSSIRCIRPPFSSPYLRWPAKRNFVSSIKGESNLEGISRNVHRLLSVRRCRIQLEDKVLAKLQKTLHEIRRCTGTAIRPVSLSSFPSHPPPLLSIPTIPSLSIFIRFLPLFFSFSDHAMKFYTGGPPST